MMELLLQKDNCFVFVFFVGSLFGFTLAFIKRKRCTKIVAEVMSYYQDKQRYYVPVLKFEVNGVMQMLQLNRGFKKKLAEEGQSLNIYYSQDEQQSIWLVKDKQDIWYSLGLLALGILSIIFLCI